MGGSLYSDAVYATRMAHHASTGTSYFVHDAKIRSGAAKAGAHESLDPSKPNKAGQIIRESRDSDAHPESRAVAVLFDETGSMGSVPGRFKDKLGKLMAALVKKGFLDHPHVLFGAIGDAANREAAPLQVGQFEGGNEMDEALANIYLEGSGGGGKQESYELAMYFMARHTSMDCVEKRGDKGYLFLCGDEVPYDNVKRTEVERIIGDKLQADIPVEDILAELREKFEVYWIYPKEGSYFNDDWVMSRLRKLFGQNLIPLERAEDICEVIAATIGVAEGIDLDAVGGALKDVGADDAAIVNATKAVSKFAGKGVAKSAKVTGGLAPSDQAVDGVERL